MGASLEHASRFKSTELVMNQFELDLEWKAKLTNVTIRVIETTIFLMSVNELVTKVEFATEQHSGKKLFG